MVSAVASEKDERVISREKSVKKSTSREQPRYHCSHAQLLSRNGYFVHESASEFLIVVKEKQIQEKQRTVL